MMYGAGGWVRGWTYGARLQRALALRLCECVTPFKLYNGVLLNQAAAPGTWTVHGASITEALSLVRDSRAHSRSSVLTVVA